MKTFQPIHIFNIVLVAPARFTKKYSEAEIFAFSVHSSAQLCTEVSDASVQVTDPGIVEFLCEVYNYSLCCNFSDVPPQLKQYNIFIHRSHG